MGIFNKISALEDLKHYKDLMNDEQCVAALLYLRQEKKADLHQKETNLKNTFPAAFKDGKNISWQEAEELAKLEAEKEVKEVEIKEIKTNIQNIENEIVKLLPIHGRFIEIDVDGSRFKVGYDVKNQYGESKEQLIVDIIRA